MESQNTLDRASNGLQLILDPLGIPFGYNLMRFLVRTWYSTPIKLPDSGLTLMFADENIEVKLHNTVSTEGFHLGIAAQSVLEANTHDHATEQAVGAVNNVIVLLSLTASAAAEDTGNRWTIDLDEATTTRTLVQHFARVPTRVPKSRPIDEPLLQRIAQRWGPTLLASPSTAARLKRALWHLQKSNLTDDLVEQFAELWLGLESINGLLIDKHSLPTSFVARNCANCGEPMHVAGSSSGITYAMKELAGATSDQAKAAREFRKTFQHGSGGIYDAVQELPGLVPLIRASLIQAIGELIGLTAEERGKLRRRAYTFKRSPGEVRVTVKLFDAPVETLLSATNLPEVRLQLMPNSEPAETSGGPTYHGNLRIGVTNHLGRWGDGSIDWVDHDDPELVQPDA